MDSGTFSQEDLFPNETLGTINVGTADAEASPTHSVMDGSVSHCNSLKPPRASPSQLASPAQL